jgi:ribonuclease BN (tRNA processing enzyme)
MKLVLLGTGGYYGNDRRQTACLMLPEVGVVLDAGSAMFRVRDYLATDRLDIFLTHAHLDHVVGLTYLLDVLPNDVLAATTVHGEGAKLAALQEHLFAEALFPISLPFRWQPLDTSCPLPGHGTLRHFQLNHPGGSIGFRLDWKDSSMAYVTDTTADADADYVEHTRGVNLLVHEAYFADSDAEMAEVTGHSCVSKVAEVAARAQVGRLILVHVNPQLPHDDELHLDGARRIFKNVDVGCDRMEVEF